MEIWEEEERCRYGGKKDGKGGRRKEDCKRDEDGGRGEMGKDKRKEDGGKRREMNEEDMGRGEER
jgi:hypothetical protein